MKIQLVVILVILVFLSPTIFWMAKEFIKDRKQIKKMDLLIEQKKEDKNFIEGYDCNSRFLAELINGMACQEMTEDQKEWEKELTEYLNKNFIKYIEAKERLHGEYYVLTC